MTGMQDNGKKTKRILIVEDDKPLVHSIAFTLKRYGYAITAVGSARDALRALSPGKEPRAFDLLITDIQLPDMTGRELIGELAEKNALPLTLVMTAYASRELFDELGRKGVRECLVKPFDIMELITRVSALLAGDSGNRSQ
jgi:DNA-binding response OmpR family regulator